MNGGKVAICASAEDIGNSETILIKLSLIIFLSASQLLPSVALLLLFVLDEGNATKSDQHLNTRSCQILRTHTKQSCKKFKIISQTKN